MSPIITTTTTTTLFSSLAPWFLSACTTLAVPGDDVPEDRYLRLRKRKHYLWLLLLLTTTTTLSSSLLAPLVSDGVGGYQARSTVELVTLREPQEATTRPRAHWIKKKKQDVI